MTALDSITTGNSETGKDTHYEDYPGALLDFPLLIKKPIPDISVYIHTSFVPGATSGIKNTDILMS